MRMLLTIVTSSNRRFWLIASVMFQNGTKQIVKRAGLNRYYGVTFKNGTKQTPGMRDAVTFQDGLDLETTN